MRRVLLAFAVGVASVGSVAVVTLACGEVLEPSGDPAGGGDASPDAPATDAPPNADSPNGGDVDAAPVTASVVATSAARVHWITYDGTRVIWSTGAVQGGATGTISACPKTGCTGMPATLASGVPTGGLGTTEATAFVTYAYGNRGVDRIELGGSLTNLSSVTPKSQIYDLTFVGGKLFFVEYGSTNLGDGGIDFRRAFHEITLPDGPATERQSFDLVNVNTANFAITADRIFAGAHNTGRIEVGKRSGGAFEPFGIGNDFYVWSFAVAGDRLYWVGAQTLMSCSTQVATCSAPTKELPVGAPEGRPLAVAERDGLLVMQRSNGDLVECAAASCASSLRVLAHEDRFFVSSLSTRNLVVDDGFIYWVAEDGDADAGTLSYRVMRLPRTPR